MSKLYSEAVDAAVQIYDAVHVIESRLNFIENYYPLHVQENGFDEIYNKLASICSDTSGLEKQIQLLHNMNKRSLVVLVRLIDTFLEKADNSSATSELLIFKEIAEKFINTK